MVRPGTVYKAARLLERTWPTESEFYGPCFCHLVTLLLLYTTEWGPSRMGKTFLPGLLEYAIWKSPVDSRWGGI